MKYLSMPALCLLIGTTSMAQTLVKTNECVIVNGNLKEVESDYNSATGDKTVLVNGVRKNFAELYPQNGMGYAAAESWFINSERIQFQNRSYTKYGLPRILGINEIVKSGMFKNVGVYTEYGLKGPAEVIYVPVRQGCEFQPYQVYCGNVKIGSSAIKGETMTLKATPTDIKGAITYRWILEGVKIIKGQGTSTIKINVKGKKNASIITVELKVNEKKACPVSSYATFVVSR